MDHPFEFESERPDSLISDRGRERRDTVAKLVGWLQYGGRALKSVDGEERTESMTLTRRVKGTSR